MIRRFHHPGLPWLLAAFWLGLASIAAAAGPQQGILWRIERDGQPVGHLFGTIHSDRPEVLDLPGPVREAFDQARRYVFELDLRETDPRQAAQMMRYSGDNSLAGQLPEALWQRARDAADERGLPSRAARTFKPWALAIVLSLPPTDPQGVLDNHLQRRALERGRPVKGLETVAEQLSVFDNLDADTQIDLLRQALDQLESGRARELYNDIVAAWRARDLVRLQELATAHPALPDGRDNSALLEALLLERNRRMIDRMQPQLDAGDVFIAVGALHLPGEDGLIRLLEARGYRLEAVY